MERATRTTRAAVATAVALSCLASCGDDTRYGLPAASDVPRPEFRTRPADLADSPQLDALVARDTAGLPADTEVAADTSLLPGAMAALAAIDDAPTQLTRVAIYGDTVYLAFNEDGIAGRSVTALYRRPFDSEEDQTPRLDIGEPSYNDAIEFPFAAVDPTVPGQIAAALAERYPLAVVRTFDLDVSGSYGFGLVWNVDLEDARGSYATVFADLDGSIIAIDGGSG